jgi:hypothetical protein
MLNGDLAEELLRANSAGLSNSCIFHIKKPRPAQLPNQQWVSEENQVPNSAGSGTDLAFHVAECGDYCFHAENGINKASLQWEEFSVIRRQSLFHS